VTQAARAFFISRKDIESYYSKPPLITWGLLFPAVLTLAVYVRDPSSYLNVAPGIIGMALLFGNTSMAAIVVTFEKRSGTFQRLLLAPVSHRTIVLGKGLSAALYGIATSLLLTAGLFLVLRMPLATPVLFIAGLLLGAATFSLLGLIAAVSVKEVFEAMTLLNFFRFPILFVSGVFMPVENLPDWVRPLSILSPLTHVVELLRLGVSGRSYFPHPGIPAAVALAFLTISWLLAERAFRRNANR
jgi:ABC-2 type transport system permease protein